jgi:hypothetical protein
MKTIFTKTTKAFFLLVLLAVVWQAGAQVPEQFNYQLAVRDAQGNVYASQQVSFRVSIMQGAAVLYQETHSTQTNAYGLVNLMIGDGTPTQGSMAAIDWGGEAKSLKVEFDPAGGRPTWQQLCRPGHHTPLLSGSVIFYITLCLEAQGNNDVGIWGISTLGMPTNIAIEALSYGNSGANYGGHFTTSSTEGTGIYAHAMATSGTSYGIRRIHLLPRAFPGIFPEGNFIFRELPV